MINNVCKTADPAPRPVPKMSWRPGNGTNESERRNEMLALNTSSAAEKPNFSLLITKSGGIESCWMTMLTLNNRPPSPYPWRPNSSDFAEGSITPNKNQVTATCTAFLYIQSTTAVAVTFISFRHILQNILFSVITWTICQKAISKYYS